MAIGLVYQICYIATRVIQRILTTFSNWRLLAYTLASIQSIIYNHVNLYILHDHKKPWLHSTETYYKLFSHQLNYLPYRQQNYSLLLHWCSIKTRRTSSLFISYYLQCRELRSDYLNGAVFTSSEMGRYAFAIHFPNGKESCDFVPSSEILKKQFYIWRVLYGPTLEKRTTLSSLSLSLSFSLIIFIHERIYNC